MRVAKNEPLRVTQEIWKCEKCMRVAKNVPARVTPETRKIKKHVSVAKNELVGALTAKVLKSV